MSFRYFVCCIALAAGCSEPFGAATEEELLGELRLGYVRHEAMPPVASSSFSLRSGDWTTLVAGADFDVHPHNPTSFSSGFLRFPLTAPLLIEFTLIAGNDTLASANFEFEAMPLHSYRFTVFPFRDSPVVDGGTHAVPLRRPLAGFPGDSLFIRWGGYDIRPIE